MRGFVTYNGLRYVYREADWASPGGNPPRPLGFIDWLKTGDTPDRPRHLPWGERNYYLPPPKP
jgi:hypothetical protein